MKLTLSILLIGLIAIACSCGEPSKPQQVDVVKKRINPFDVYLYTHAENIIVSNMNYAIIYGTSIVNITKDSLEVEALKTQKLRDSLQIEVFRKYLTK